MEMTLKDQKNFKAKYKKAVEEKKENFVFNGETIFTGYAKYVIEYIDSLNKKK